MNINIAKIKSERDTIERRGGGCGGGSGWEWKREERGGGGGGGGGNGVYFPDAWEKPPFFTHPLLKVRTVSVTYATDRGILVIS
jgi:hypothetical protein